MDSSFGSRYAISFAAASTDMGVVERFVPRSPEKLPSVHSVDLKPRHLTTSG